MSIQKKIYETFAIVALVLVVISTLPLVLRKQNESDFPVSRLAASTPSTFQVFDATSYVNKPDLRAYGIKPINLIYGQFLYKDGKIDKTLPSQKKIKQFAEEASRKNQLVILELEQWPLKGSDEVVADSVQNLIQVIKWFRDSQPELQIGLYSVLPVFDYWRALKGPDSQEYKEWQKENDRMRPILKYVDMVFPDLYTHYADRNGWVQYATENIREARRYGKPVYAFVWPQYHSGSNKILGHTYLSADYWMVQLETLRTHADGVVIWGGWDWDNMRFAQWNENACWWRATKEFLRKLNREVKS